MGWGDPTGKAALSEQLTRADRRIAELEAKLAAVRDIAAGPETDEWDGVNKLNWIRDVLGIPR